MSVFLINGLPPTTQQLIEELGKIKIDQVSPQVKLVLMAAAEMLAAQRTALDHQQDEQDRLYAMLRSK